MCQLQSLAEVRHVLTMNIPTRTKSVFLDLQPVLIPQVRGN